MPNTGVASDILEKHKDIEKWGAGVRKMFLGRAEKEEGRYQRPPIIMSEKEEDDNDWVNWEPIGWTSKEDQLRQID